MTTEIKMNFKKLFIVDYLDFSYYTAVIIDLDTHLFYHALFLRNQCGRTITHYLRRTGQPISIENIRELAEKSIKRRAKPYLSITEDNWKDLVFGSDPLK